MPQTFYIENDEEIISAIGRLRTSPAEENYFVFPKRALILQSIVNLRLFAREAQKMNKKVIVVTQDETGKMLAEKAGLPTENYSEAYAERDHHVELSRDESALPPAAAAAASPEPPKEQGLPRSAALGSSAFFDGAAPEPDLPLPAPEPAPEPEPAPKRLRIRNASPERPPALNSMRKAPVPPVAPPVPPRPEVPSRPPLPIASPEQGGPERIPAAIFAPHSGRGQVSGERKDALKRFFGEGGPAPRPAGPSSRPPAVPPRRPAPEPPKPEKPAKASSPKVHQYSFRRIFIPLGLLTFFSLAAVLAFIFLPSVDIFVTPQTAERKLDLDLTGKTGDGVEASGTTLPVWTLESDVTVTITQEATGLPSSGSSSERAGGTVTITNNYGSEPQTLVATTRLETDDGKIFRLVEQVEVPGKSGDTPGSIQARVIADRAGSEYNIGPSTFTIPGFKGSDKFAAFKAESTAPMQGGGGEGRDDATITESDLARAQAKAEAEVREKMEEALSGYLKEGEALIEPTLRLEATPDRSGIPAEGSTAGEFEYRRTYHGLAYAYSEEFLRRLVEENFSASGSGGIILKPSRIEHEFGEVSENQETKELSITLHAEVFLEAEVDQGALESALLGKNTAGIEAALKDFPSVSKVRLEFHPDWIRGNIPRSESRVNLHREPAAAQEG